MSSESKYTFFWKGPLSNWVKSPFVVDNIDFNCGEQYMMFSKAYLFQDAEIMAEVMKTTNPREQKSLGRLVKNFDYTTWDENCIDIMVKGLYAKFSQNPAFKEYILSTVGSELVEASPVDIIWGVGLAEEDSRILDKSQWRGKNYLGITLMKVRDKLLAEEECEAI